MSSREGITGTGNLHYPADPGLLSGVLASEVELKVYPDNYCRACELAGRDFDRCFHYHWNQEKEAK